MKKKEQYKPVSIGLYCSEKLYLIAQNIIIVQLQHYQYKKLIL